jgi:precorrin-2 dehydrogenase/sirohydrochlorin ferrochelatase
MNRYYPIYLDLKDKPCVIVGGGEVAERKAKSLLSCGARVLVISPRLNQGLEKLYQKGLIHYQAGDFSKQDFSKALLVIGATDNREINSQIAQEARKQGILVNIVDNPAECDFIVPASLKRGDLLITISTGGKSPALARKIREELEERFGEEYEEFLSLMGELREAVKERISEQAHRERLFSLLIDSDIIQLLKIGQKEKARRKAQEIINHYSGDTEK